MASTPSVPSKEVSRKSIPLSYFIAYALHRTRSGFSKSFVDEYGTLESIKSRIAELEKQQKPDHQYDQAVAKEEITERGDDHDVKFNADPPLSFPSLDTFTYPSINDPPPLTNSRRNHQNTNQRTAHSNSWWPQNWQSSYNRSYKSVSAYSHQVASNAWSYWQGVSHGIYSSVWMPVYYAVAPLCSCAPSPYPRPPTPSAAGDYSVNDSSRQNSFINSGSGELNIRYGATVNNLAEGATLVINTICG